MVATSCRSTKNIETSSNQVSLKENKESDSLRNVINDLKIRHEKELKEAAKTGVVFDERDCPPVVIPESCPKDSLVKLIAALYKQISSMSNKIKINADGSIEAEGKIKSAYSDKEKLEKENTELALRNEEQARLIQKQQTEFEALQKQKSKAVTRSSFPWILLLISLSVGLIIEYKTKILRRTLSLFKNKNKNTMKQLIFLFMTCLFLASCGGAGQLPTDYITFGQAFSHCASTGSYWLWVGIALLVSGVTLFFLFRAYGKSQDWSGGYTLVLFACVVILFLAFLMRPAEVAANTTVEQAARGVYIGY